MNSTNVCGRFIGHQTAQYPFVIVDSISLIVSTLTIRRTPRLHSPSNVLLAGLALSDPSGGVFYQLTRIVAILRPRTSMMKNYALTLMSLIYLFTKFSLLTLTAISVDRYLALRLHLRFEELVPVKKVVIALLITRTVVLFVNVLPLAIVQNVSIFKFVLSLDLLCVVVMIWSILESSKPFAAFRIRLELKSLHKTTQCKGFQALSDIRNPCSTWCILLDFF